MKRVCVVAGVGPGNGAAFARRFAAEGHAVALLARSDEFTRQLAASLPEGRAYSCDLADPASIARTFEGIRADLGEPEVLVYNAGSGVWGTVEEATPGDFEKAWRVNTFGAFLCARQVIPAMKRAGRGSIVLVGATASRKGGPKSAAFSSVKFGQRGLAESMARALWPAGIHVALIVVDGVVDLTRTRERMRDKPDSFFIQPDDVADVGFRLTQQARSAWSFEVEARPFAESW